MIRTVPFAILLILVSAIWLTGCIPIPILDDIIDDSDREDVTREIIVNQTGGFAGFSRTTRITEEEDSISLIFTDHVFNQHKEATVPPEDLDELWKTLEENDVFTLSTNMRMLATVMDAFSFEVIIQQGEKRNSFSVYAPDLLFQDTGEKRYDAIVDAILGLTEPLLADTKEFVVGEMAVTNIEVLLLESFPLQVHIVVKGYLNDACTMVNETTQRRDGYTIRVRITTKRPKDAMCAQVITETTVRVPLEGVFFPGRYKVMVNDVEKDFDIQGQGFQEEPNILQGKVTIGPLCPVEPCDIPPDRIAEIYTARKVMVYEQRTKEKVAETNLDKDGKYTFSLGPGMYIVDVSDAEGNALPLDPAERPRIGNAIPQEIELRFGDLLTVDFDIDTGIR